MTRGNLLIISVLVIALAGMFFWTLNLEQRLGTTAEPGAGPSGDGRLTERIDALEGKVDGLDERTRGNQIEIGEVQGKLTKLSASDLEQTELLAALQGGGATLASGTPVDPDVKKTVEAILAERAEKERKERTERMVRGWSRYLLADIEATKEQQDNFVAVVSAFMDGRRAIGEKYQDQGDAGKEARDADIKALEADRNQKLQGIFGAADYQKIEERFNQTQRRMSGRGGGRFGGRNR